MNFISLSLFFSPFIGFSFYKIFINKYAECCESFTNNNYPKSGIKYIENMKDIPKARKRVRFSNEVENIYNTTY